jgi:hypothetical protein
MASYPEQNYVGKYNPAQELMPRSETVRARTEFQLNDYRARVTRLEELLKLLDENPEFERMMTLLGGGL